MNTFLIILLQHFEKLMEGVQVGEKNTIEVKVNSNMTRGEVVDKIIKDVEQLSTT